MRESGMSVAKAASEIKRELDKHESFSRVAPAKLVPRTIQIWKSKKAKKGPGALVPTTQKCGNRDVRYDSTYEEIAWDVLEELYLTNDRLSLGKIASNVKKKYLDKCSETGAPPLDCGKRCLETILKSLSADDVIKARHDSATARKLRLQAQFYHRIEAPFDLIEIDSTLADIMIVNDDRVCIGRPTLCLAVDAASGFILSIRLSLSAPKEALTIRVLKDTMSERSDEFFEKYGIKNRLRLLGSAQMVHSDQGSENSGYDLSRIVEALGMEWAKNIPGCPDRKPFVERMMRVVNEFLHTLPGATTSKEMRDRERIDKAMLEASLTLDELEAILMKWAYDVHAKTLRRGIHSPLRCAESPAECWQRLEWRFLQVKTPEEIRNVFCSRTVERTLQRYGIEVHRHTTVHRTTVEAVCTDRTRFVDKAAFRDFLGVSRNQYEILVEAGVLASVVVTNLPPLVDANHDLEAARALLDRIARGAVEIGGDSISLKDINLRFTTDRSGVVAVLRAVHDGDLPPARDSTSGKLATFAFDRAAIEDILRRTLRGPGLTIQEVGRMTGWKDQCIAHWCDLGLLDHETYAHGSGKGRIIRPESLARFQIRFAPLASVAKEVGTSSRKLMSVLSDHGVETVGAMQEGAAWRGHLVPLAGLARISLATARRCSSERGVR